MNIKDFILELEDLDIDFYTGVPDSFLTPLCDYLMSHYGISSKHIVAANEGAAVGLAAGHYLATGKKTLIYMQNSGIGNAVNPICSLINREVYAIPALFVIGWRGEPNIKDEPQHIFQGKITPNLLSCIGVKYHILTEDDDQSELQHAVSEAKKEFEQGNSYAFIVKKGALINDIKGVYQSDKPLSREEVIHSIVESTYKDSIFISTTGKLSRELFEIREKLFQDHERDFLTVGSMGHSSMIALGIAKERTDKKVFCLDGDGALLMHMGSLAVIGSNSPSNFIHVLINNSSHETVGGIPTVSDDINYGDIALACGYKKVYRIKTKEELLSCINLINFEVEGPIWIEVFTNLESRKDLGRPTKSTIENKEAFMNYIRGEK